ncbi:hypothetical protein [Pokkaliibacter plantistimulans]|nr:hypothetical protein [Pokkaliibacter plantistimulans]
MSEKLASLLENTKVLEIVELENGEMLLQLHDEDEVVPLIKLQVVSEMRDFLGEQYLEMARGMLSSGVQALTEKLAERQAVEVGSDAPRILH